MCIYFFLNKPHITRTDCVISYAGTRADSRRDTFQPPSLLILIEKLGGTEESRMRRSAAKYQADVGALK